MLLWSATDPFTPILDPLTPNLKCTHYYVGVPLSANDKTNFHPGVKNELDAIHERGSNFHALAEFHWGSWRQWTIDNNKTWFDAGVEFRRRMDAAGFDLHYGDSDTWAINELPTSVLHSDDPNMPASEVRAHAIAAIRGLYQGPNQDVNKKGVVYRAGVGQNYTNLGAMNEAKQRAKAWLMDSAFWASMNEYVRFWAEETYADPYNECVPSTLAAARAGHIDDYVFHLPNLAEKGPAIAARNFFRKTFTPLLNGSWGTVEMQGYGRNHIGEDAFKNHVSTEVYAVRAWQNQHPAYGNRLGFAWAPASSDRAATDRVGARIGNAVDDVFKPGHGASYACSPSGAFTLCQCKLEGAQFIEAWRVWDSW